MEKASEQQRVSSETSVRYTVQQSPADINAQVMLNVDSSVSLSPELLNSALPSDIRNDLLQTGTILIA